MLAGRFTQQTLRLLDWLAATILPPEDIPEHQRVGKRGEEDAYFYLRRLGYIIIARNFRSPHHRGELDLVGWDGDILCFIEVKTRTARGMATAESAVDHDKRRDLSLVARDFMQIMPDECQSRFDVLAVYYDNEKSDAAKGSPAFELFQNAFSISYNRGSSESHSRRRH